MENLIVNAEEEKKEETLYEEIFPFTEQLVEVAEQEPMINIDTYKKLDNQVKKPFVAKYSVLGNTNVGKSTFINKLLGETITISSAKRETANYCTIKRQEDANKPKFEIIMKNHKEFSASDSKELMKKIKEEFNGLEKKKFKIWVQGENIKLDLESKSIVDGPGFNESTFEQDFFLGDNFKNRHKFCMPIFIYTLTDGTANIYGYNKILQCYQNTELTVYFVLTKISAQWTSTENSLNDDENSEVERQNILESLNDYVQKFFKEIAELCKQYNIKDYHIYLFDPFDKNNLYYDRKTGIVCLSPQDYSNVKSVKTQSIELIREQIEGSTFKSKEDYKMLIKEEVLLQYQTLIDQLKIAYSGPVLKKQFENITLLLKNSIKDFQSYQETKIIRMIDKKIKDQIDNLVQDFLQKDKETEKVRFSKGKFLEALDSYMQKNMQSFFAQHLSNWQQKCLKKLQSDMNNFQFEEIQAENDQLATTIHTMLEEESFNIRGIIAGSSKLNFVTNGLPINGFLLLLAFPIYLINLLPQLWTREGQSEKYSAIFMDNLPKIQDKLIQIGKENITMIGKRMEDALTEAFSLYTDEKKASLLCPSYNNLLENQAKLTQLYSK